MSKGKQIKEVDVEGEILTREESLRILSDQARKGSVSAAVALERVLRPGDPPDDWDDELARILGQ